MADSGEQGATSSQRRDERASASIAEASAQPAWVPHTSGSEHAPAPAAKRSKRPQGTAAAATESIARSAAKPLPRHKGPRAPKREYLCSRSGCPRSVPGNGFSHASNKTQHERTHNNVKPYACRYPNCTKSYAHTTSRNDHEAVFHRGERPYPCKVPGCARTFTSSANVARHIRQFHARDPKRVAAVGASASSFSTAAGAAIPCPQQQQQQRSGGSQTSKENTATPSPSAAATLPENLAPRVQPAALGGGSQSASDGIEQLLAGAGAALSSSSAPEPAGSVAVTVTVTPAAASGGAAQPPARQQALAVSAATAATSNPPQQIPSHAGAAADSSRAPPASLQTPSKAAAASAPGSGGKRRVGLARAALQATRTHTLDGRVAPPAAGRAKRLASAAVSGGLITVAAQKRARMRAALEDMFTPDSSAAVSSASSAAVSNIEPLSSFRMGARAGLDLLTGAAGHLLQSDGGLGAGAGPVSLLQQAETDGLHGHASGLSFDPGHQIHAHGHDSGVLLDHSGIFASLGHSAFDLHATDHSSRPMQHGSNSASVLSLDALSTSRLGGADAARAGTAPHSPSHRLESTGAATMSFSADPLMGLAAASASAAAASSSAALASDTAQPAANAHHGSSAWDSDSRSGATPRGGAADMSDDQ